MKRIALVLLFVLMRCASTPAFAGSTQFVPPLTSGAAVLLSSSSLGTSPALVLVRDSSRGFLQFQNTSSVNSLACTLDGTVPAINGNGIQLAPLMAATYDEFVPTGALNCVGSSASTSYTVVYLP